MAVYDSNWRQKALDTGQDVNSAQFAQNREMEAGGGGGSDIQSAIRMATKQQQEAIKPAVEQLQSTVAPLQKRYSELLDSIKGNQQTDVNKQTVITSNELGKRGILGSSTLASQEVQNAIQPINASYSGVLANTGIAQEKDLSAIAQAIAQLQSGAAQTGIQTGTGIYQSQLQQQLQQQQLQQQADQQARENEIARKQLENQTLKTQYEIGAPYFKPESGGGDNGIATILQSLLNNNKSGAPKPPSYNPYKG